MVTEFIDGKVVITTLSEPIVETYLPEYIEQRIVDYTKLIEDNTEQLNYWLSLQQIIPK